MVTVEPYAIVVPFPKGTAERAAATAAEWWPDMARKVGKPISEPTVDILDTEDALSAMFPGEESEIMVRELGGVARATGMVERQPCSV